MSEETLFLLSLGKEIIFRPLTIKEAHTISKSSDLPSHALNEWITERCVLFNREWLHNEAPAGYLDTVARSILEESTVKDEQAIMQLLDSRREEVSSLQSAIEMYICAAFKNYTPDQARDMSQYKQMSLVAMSEAMLNTKLDLEEIFNPKKRQQKRRGPPQAPPGFSSLRAGQNQELYQHQGDVDIENILSEANADKPDFEHDNAYLE